MRNYGTIPCRRQALVLAGLLAWVLLAGTASVNSAENDSPVAATREALDKWVETCKAVAKERRDLALKKEMLRERIDVVQREIDSFRRKIEDTRKSVAEAEAKRAELAEQNDKLKAASSVLAGAVGGMETRTLELVKQVPPPLADMVGQLTQQFPKDPNNPTKEQTLGRRYQNLIGTLTQINKANREIRTSANEQITLPDGRSVAVTAVYVGLGEALYASENGQYAGVGRAGPDGWVWTPANESAESISKVIAILKKGEVAAYVQVPVEIK